MAWLGQETGGPVSRRARGLLGLVLLGAGAVALPALPALALTSSPGVSVERAPESAAVAARFPDPEVHYSTPAFEPGRDAFTSNAELRVLMQQLARDSQLAPAGGVRISLRSLGSSQTGVPLEALYFSRVEASHDVGEAPPAEAIRRPTALLVGQQHGDEPAGAEALIVIAQELAHGRLAALLDHIDVVILARANPDGAAAGRRFTASGIDMNRDHLLLRTPEAQALAQLAREFEPVVFVDAHEFSVLGRYVEKFGAVQRFDALLQYAMTANLPEFVSRAAEEWFRQPMQLSLKAQKLSTEWYYTTSLDRADLKVSMGGVQPDTGRNVNGLRNAVSLLIETRGAGLGRAHLLRRVHTQVTAITTVLTSAAAHAADLVKLRRFVDADVAAQACQGDVIVEAAATRGEYELLMLDPATGADKRVTVTWDSALELRPVKQRARPCGYWLGVGEQDAVRHLRALGVQVQRIDEVSMLRGEAYTETGREIGQTSGARADVRGSLTDAAGVQLVKVGLKPALVDGVAGSYYVGLDQPLANLIVAALEPDTQNSFLANHIVMDLSALARVTHRPDAQMTPLP